MKLYRKRIKIKKKGNRNQNYPENSFITPIQPFPALKGRVREGAFF
jgi:hypothetical protein